MVGDRPAYLARVDVHSAAASTALRRLAPGLADAPGFDPQRPLTADAHHLVRAAARDRLTPEQRGGPGWPRSTPRPPTASSPCTSARGPDIGGLDDWRRTARHRARRRGRRLLGRSGHQRRAGQSADRRAPAPAGWPATCSSTARSARAPRGCTSPTPTPRTAAATRYLDPDAITAHLRACTEAGITAGFHVIGDAAVAAVVDALARVVDRFGAPAVARCGHRLEHLEMVTAEQAARLGAWGVHRQHAAQLRRAVGRRRRHVCPASRRRPSHAAESVRAVSIPRRAPRLRLRLPRSPA